MTSAAMAMILVSMTAPSVPLSAGLTFHYPKGDTGRQETSGVGASDWIGLNQRASARSARISSGDTGGS